MLTPFTTAVRPMTMAPRPTAAFAAMFSFAQFDPRNFTWLGSSSATATAPQSPDDGV